MSVVEDSASLTQWNAVLVGTVYICIGRGLESEAHNCRGDSVGLPWVLGGWHRSLTEVFGLFEAGDSTLHVIVAGRATRSLEHQRLLEVGY